jgi:hypothetical protein
MEVSIPAATKAIEEFLGSIMTFDDSIVGECDELLRDIWYVDNSQIRLQIIQTAALNTGWLTEEQVS